MSLASVGSKYPVRFIATLSHTAWMDRVYTRGTRNVTARKPGEYRGGYGQWHVSARTELRFDFIAVFEELRK